MLVEIATKVCIWFSAMVSIIFHPPIILFFLSKTLTLFYAGYYFVPRISHGEKRKNAPYLPKDH